MPEQPQPRVLAMRARIQALYRQGNAAVQHDQVLNNAFEELALALEQLQMAEQELNQRDDEWLNRRAELDMELQRYKSLFEHAPLGYLVTSIDGAIRQANAGAAELLQSSERLLIGRSLALFVPEGQRRAFRQTIAELAQSQRAQELQAHMQSWRERPFEARLTIRPLLGATGQVSALYWLICETGAHAAGKPHAARAPDAAHAYIERDELAQRQFRFMAEASQWLATAQDLQATLIHVGRLAVPAIADGLIVDLVEPQSGTNRQLAVVRAEDAAQPPHIFQHQSTPAGRATEPPSSAPQRPSAALVQPQVGDLTSDAELRTILKALGPTSAIVVPLQGQGSMLGSLTLLLASTERQLSATELALAEELALRIAAAAESEPSLH